MTIPVTVIGGSNCSHRYTSDGIAKLTQATIILRPDSGTVEQTGALAFTYRPKAGFKGSDAYSIKVCGDSGQGPGCTKMIYQLTVE